MKIEGLVSIVTDVHLDASYELLFSEMEEIITLHDSQKNNVLWIDHTGTAPFEILASKLNSPVRSPTRPNLLDRVTYSQCFDLDGILQTLEEMDSTNLKLIVLCNMYQLFLSEKLADHTKAHKTFVETMLKLRKTIDQDECISICLFDVESKSAKNETFMLDYYVTERYRMTDRGLIDKAVLC